MNRGTPLDNNVLHGATIAYGRFLVEGTTKDNCELCVYLHAFSFVFPLRKKGLQYSIQHYQKASKLLIACKPIYQRVSREEVCKPQGSSIFPAFFGVNYYYYYSVHVQLQSTFCLEKYRARRATEQEFPSSGLSKGIR